jgi:hypothetical protein
MENFTTLAGLATVDTYGELGSEQIMAEVRTSSGVLDAVVTRTRGDTKS